MLLLSMLGIYHHVLIAQALIPLDEENYIHQLASLTSLDEHSEIKLINLLKTSEFYVQRDSTKSLFALQQAKKVLNEHLQLAPTYHYYVGLYEGNRGNKKEAIRNLQLSIQQLNHSKDSSNQEVLALAHYQNTILQVGDKGYDSMVQTLINTCIPIAQQIKNTELLTYFYTQLGMVFMSVGEFQKGIEQHEKAIKTFQNASKPSPAQLITYLNLISNYCYIPDSKSAKIYLDLAEPIIKKYPKSQHLANYYYQVGLYHTTKTNYNEALIALKKGIQYAHEYQQIQLLQILHFRLYNVYLMQKDYLTAKQILENLIHDNQLTKDPVNRRVTFAQLAQVNELLGDFKTSLTWLKKSNQLTDSLQSAKMKEKMLELESLHQHFEKNKTIEKLQVENQAHELSSKDKSDRIFILVIGILLFFTISLLIYKNYLKQRKLNEQIQINHQKDLDKIDQIRKQEAVEGILKGEEQERQRIAKDLHDSIGGMLASIRMSLNPALNTNEISKIDMAIVEMRRISRNLMPETLNKLGLDVALKELCETFSTPNLTIQYESYNLQAQFPFALQINLYRSVQECLSNAIKYAQASSIIVQLSQSNNLLQLTIEDNGIGFDMNEVKHGLGLSNIRHRIKLINGNLEILSTKSEGTTINMECYVN